MSEEGQTEMIKAKKLKEQNTGCCGVMIAHINMLLKRVKINHLIWLT